MAVPETLTLKAQTPGNGSIASLQANIHGQALHPSDPRYAGARLAWNRTVDQHPALIVVAAHAGDVTQAVRFARQHGLGVAVQSTGHGISLAADGALLIVTSKMKELHVNPQTQTAWISAGLEWGEVLQETQRHGLAPLLGSSPNVGVVGYTLGGGLGWLARKYGLAADSVLTFELVNAAGELVRASASENPDLFWGLRGGGGSFGVITAMEIRLYPVSTVYGGSLMYPGEQAREILRRYREFIQTAPDELTTSVALMNFPPLPQLPEFLRGKSFVMLRGCFTGSSAEGEALLRPWREWQAPIVDDFKEMPFSDVARISSDPLDPMPARDTGAWIRELSDEAVETLVSYAFPVGRPPAITMTEVRHIGGAVSRGKAVDAAYGNREAQLLLFCVAVAPTPEAYTQVSEYLDAMKADLAPALTGGIYMNFVAGHEARQRSRDGYSPSSFRRLKALKGQVDPENLFRYSYDISPE